ncbi:peroxisomal succinyl-coenzyme A thioesterase-like [Ochotona curzoniae]|uniref:peroxisomal succinyl-coenzyme A thioesterase-like n=1 Tax=Ochotona curzoniae TaxID=130825 RepID=UPI001B351C30|nr:peroxisomal succinyl-coenzyme A thioesterase-like [Ochotona curzoniae]
MEGAAVSVEPAGPSCWDEPLRIAVRGLAPEQPVTLRSALRDEKGALFRAHARYCADARGELDLERAPALGGSFAGLEPMGLFWAMEPDRRLWRLIKRDVQTPFVVELEVLDGHDPEPERVLTRAVLERHFLPPGVRREAVRAGRVRATLFLPPGPGPFPGVIDIFGVGGGLMEYRASLLAGHGFATMALAFYNFEDLPKKCDSINLDYFEEALCYMIEHPQVKGPGIGLLGISLGADICILMASFLKNVSATVSINGFGFIEDMPIHYRQISILPLDPDMSRIKREFSNFLDIVDIRKNVVGGHSSMIPVEKAQGPILCIVGKDPHIQRCQLFALFLCDRQYRNGKNSLNVFLYAGTGHYIEPPFFPMFPASLHRLPNYPNFRGMEPSAHSFAQVDAWKEIISFFGKHLGGAQMRPAPKL